MTGEMDAENSANTGVNYISKILKSKKFTETISQYYSSCFIFDQINRHNVIKT